MMRAIAVFVLLLASCDKGSNSSTPSGGVDDSGRVPLVHKDHALYNRLEGVAFANACDSDAACVRGGCSGEVCAATKDIMSTCEALPVTIPAAASCGCVAHQCTWWSDGSAKLEQAANEPPAPAEGGGACGEQTCAANETCIEYYGVAGPRGPKFQTCGIRCGEGGKCPDGLRCVTIADGPGPVCKP